MASSMCLPRFRELVGIFGFTGQLTVVCTWTALHRLLTDSEGVEQKIHDVTDRVLGSAQERTGCRQAR